jgi:hypothetical protein
MHEADRPNESEEEESLTEPPAAVQWMMQQAAAGQSTVSRPALDDGLMAALAPASSEEALAARQRRVVEALRGNARLTGELPPDAAEALMSLGETLAHRVVADTAGLDDAAAEAILQPRVRAVRRLMMAVAEAGPAGAPPVAESIRQASVALGERFAAPDEEEESALAAEWRAAAGQPARQVALLQRLIDDHTVHAVR